MAHPTKSRSKRPKNKIKRVNRGDKPVKAGDLVAQGRPTEMVAEDLLARAMKAESNLKITTEVNEILQHKVEEIKIERDFYKQQLAKATERLEAVSNKVIVRKSPKLHWWTRFLHWLVWFGVSKVDPTGFVADQVRPTTRKIK